MHRVRISLFVGKLLGGWQFTRLVPVTFLLLVSNCAIVFAQHDGARDSVQQIAVGKYGNVDDLLANKKPFAGEAESAFVKMLQAIAEEQITLAEEHGRLAVELGLPPERILVGPKELFRCFG